MTLIACVMLFTTFLAFKNDNFPERITSLKQQNDVKLRVAERFVPFVFSKWAE